MSENRTAAKTEMTPEQIREVVRRSLSVRDPRPTGRDLAGLPDSLVEALSATTEQSVELHRSLDRFVGAEIDFWIDHGAVEENMLDADDVLSAAYVKALEQAEYAPGGQGLYPWLRRLAKDEIKATAIRKAERAASEVSLEEPVLRWGPGWPDRTRRVKDDLSDDSVPGPQQSVETQELKSSIDRVLRRLPERWREVFLLSTVDGWSDRDIATLENEDVPVVRWMIEASQAFLTEWLADANDYDARVVREHSLARGGR